jgi:hypothetical protein
MNKLKIILITALFIGFTSAGFANSHPDISKVQSLNLQIKEEIVEVLNLPVYLSFTDKNLSGKANVVIIVGENGKILLAGVNSTNKILNEYLRKKIASRNLWTSTKYKGLIFKYEIEYGKNS